MSQASGRSGEAGEEEPGAAATSEPGSVRAEQYLGLEAEALEKRVSENEEAPATDSNAPTPRTSMLQMLAERASQVDPGDTGLLASLDQNGPPIPDQVRDVSLTRGPHSTPAQTPRAAPHAFGMAHVRLGICASCHRICPQSASRRECRLIKVAVDWILEGYGQRFRLCDERAARWISFVVVEAHASAPATQNYLYAVKTHHH